MTTDSQTAEMKRLFAIGFQENPNKWVPKQEVYQIVRSPDNDLFGWLDLTERSGQTTLGKRLREFAGRCLGGIYLQIDTHDNRRPRYRFTREHPPTQENMAAAVLGSRQTGSDQKGTCQPRQHSQPLQPLIGFSNHPYAGSAECGAGAEVVQVDIVAKPDAEKPVSLVEQGPGVLPLADETTGDNLRRDENGCPLPPIGLMEPEPLPTPSRLPKLDMRTRLERVSETMAVLDRSSCNQTSFLASAPDRRND